MKKNFKLVKEKNSFQIHWEKKSVKEIFEDREDGTKKVSIEIEGYASTKDKDRGNDIVEPKAFEEALATYMTNPIILLQHKHDKPIGVVTEAKIDNKGLYIKANISQNTDGAMDAIKDGVLRTFSIGYGVKEGDYEVNEFIDENGNADYTTTIKKLELYEISVVSVPMNAYALMKSIEDCFEVEEIEDETDQDFGKNENQENDSSENENEENGGDKITEEMHGEENEDSENKEETLSGNITFIQKENEEMEEKIENNTDEIKEDVIEEKEDVKVEEEKSVENTDENKTDETVEQEVAENANIEKPEEENSSENAPEMEVNDNEKSIVEEKSMEGISKNLYDEKSIDEIVEKKLSTKLMENQKAVENLNNELGKVKDVLKSAIQVIGEMDAALRNTVIKTGATYSQVSKKKSAWSDVISKAKSSI